MNATIITVSIIIPVYNVEAYLKRCVDSLLSQTLNNIEIILVDDGSTDKSGEICDEYSAKFNHVITLHQQNAGPSVARNSGINAARGKYILFIDSDDYILPEAGKVLTDLAEKYQCEIVRGNGTLKNKEIEKPYKQAPVFEQPVPGVQFLTAMIRRQYALTVCPPFGLYKRTFLLEHKLFFKENLLEEDELWMPLVYLKAKKVAALNYYFYYHWIVPNSRGRKPWSEQRKRAIFEICRILYPVYQKEKMAYRRILCDSLCSLYLNAINCMQDKKANRFFALKTAGSMRNYIKAFLFFVSPALYFKIYRAFKGEIL